MNTNYTSIKPSSLETSFCCVDPLVVRDASTVTMYLTARPKSAICIAAIGKLAASIITLKGSRQKASKQYHDALGTIVADLVKASSYAVPRPCYRPLGQRDFTGKAGKGIGYEPFTRALNDLEKSGFVNVVRGDRAFRDREGFVTRIFVTPKLTDYLAVQGIAVCERFKHFSYRKHAEDEPPIKLRASSSRKKGKKVHGSKMTVDYKHPLIPIYAEQIKRLNAFIGKQVITGPEEADLDDIALCRVFNCGDEPGHDYRKGGRAYAQYQNIESAKRSEIRINGEEVVEVDISACFLTIAHYLLGLPFDNDVDPYFGPNLPRPIIKAWVNMTLSHGKYHRKWPGDTVDDLEDPKRGGMTDVRRLYPIKAVREETLKHLPIVETWVQSGFSWADLFFVESEIVLSAIDQLALQYDTTALPLHDGIIVSSSSKDISMSVLSKTFLDITDIIPIISFKKVLYKQPPHPYPHHYTSRG